MLYIYFCVRLLKNRNTTFILYKVLSSYMDRITERGKNVYNGSENIDQMIECLQKRIEHLENLQEEGWELRETVEFDYAFLIREE